MKEGYFDKNYFIIGEKITDRLTEAFKDFDNPRVKVIPWADSSPEKSAKQFAPALIVAYMGDGVRSDSPGGVVHDKTRQLIEQKWLVGGIFKDAASQLQGTASRSTAGPVIPKMLRALMGYEIIPGVTLKRIYPSAPAHFENSYLLLSYAFSATIPF